MHNIPEKIADAQDIIEANNREQLGLILASKNKIPRIKTSSMLITTVSGSPIGTITKQLD
jgi:hypothetical protein